MANRGEQGSALARGFDDGALLVLGALLGALFGLASLRLLLTALSEADYGRYSLFLAAAGVLAVTQAWAVPGAVRLGAEERLRTGSLGRTAGSLLLLVLACALLGAVALVPLRGRLEGWLQAPLTLHVIAYACASTLAQLGATLLQPAGWVGLRTLVPAASRALYAALLAAIVLRGEPLALEQAALLCVLTALPGIALPAALLARALRPLAPERRTLRRATAFGWPLLLHDLGVVGVLYVDLVLVRHYLGPIEAGRYDVAYRLAEQAVVLGLVLRFLIAPALAEAAARGERGPLERLYRVAAPQIVWLWGLGAALLIALAEPALTLLGARSPAESAAVLRLVALAVALRGAALLESAVFEAYLLSRWPTVFFFAGFALNLGLGLLLLERGWGLAGPAVATVAGFALQGGLRAIYLGRALGLPALRPYLGVLPALLMFGLARLLAGSPALALAAWVALAAGVLLLGRALGLFPAETRRYLAAVRMPAPLRRALIALYPPEPVGPAP